MNGAKFLSFSLCTALAVVGCKHPNHSPDAPVVTGPSFGYVDSTYTFAAFTTDPDGDSVAYRFVRDNGDTSEWSAFVASGETATMTYAWDSAGDHLVKSEAKDCSGASSQWSAGLVSSISPFDYPWRVVSTVQAGRDPTCAVPRPDGRYVYVASEHKVFVMRTADFAVVDSINVEADCPRDIAVHPEGEYVYLSNDDDGDDYDGDAWVRFIATRSLTVTDSVNIGCEPIIAISPGGERLYVAHTADDSEMAYVSYIDVRSGSVVDSMALGPEHCPSDVVLLPSGDRLYVVCWDEVVVLQTGDRVLIDSVQFAGHLEFGDASPDGEYVYFVSEAPSGTLWVVRTMDNAVIDTIPLGRYPTSIVVLPNGRYAYVGIGQEDSVLVIRTDTRAVVATIPVGPWPRVKAVTPDGRQVYVESGGTISVIGF